MKNYIFIQEDGSANCFSGDWKIIKDLEKGEVQENIVGYFGDKVVKVLVGSDNQDVSDYDIFYNKYGVSQ